MQATSERHAEKLSPGFTFTLSLCQSTTTQQLFTITLGKSNQTKLNLTRPNQT